MRLGGVIQKSMRGISFAASLLALTAIVSLSFGVTRYAPFFDIAMNAYGSVANFAFGSLVESVADWLARLGVGWFSHRLEVGDHWKDVFTLMTLYAFADASQFVGRWVSPPSPESQRWREFNMALTALGVGFVLSLGAAIISGLSPVSGDWAAGLALFLPAVGAFGLYATALAWAHATWNRENYRLFTGRDETWSEAFSWRVRAALRRAMAGAAAGLVIYGLARIGHAGSPGLLTLAILALGLGVFWIYRAGTRPGLSGPWRMRLAGMKEDHNCDMGLDMILKVLGGFLLAGLNAGLV